MPLSVVGYAVASGNAHDVFALDDEAIRTAAAAGCVGITDASSTPGLSRTERIHAVDDAIATLVTSVRSLGPERLDDDRPAVDWLADWEDLARRRESYAKELEAGVIRDFEVPVVDGVPVTQRMADVAPPECASAVAVAAQP
jgi:hypothetical protein